MFRAKTHKEKTGSFGEDIACRYLIGKGYRVLERNYRKPWGELDIIAVCRDNTLVFVEVKTLKDNYGNGLMPEDNLTVSKLRKLQKTCRQYVAENHGNIREDRGWRIDLVAVTIPPETDKPDIGNCRISHYENI